MVFVVDGVMFSTSVLVVEGIVKNLLSAYKLALVLAVASLHFGHLGRWPRFAVERGISTRLEALSMENTQVSERHNQ